MTDTTLRDIVNIAYDVLYDDASVAQKSKAKQIFALFPQEPKGVEIWEYWDKEGVKWRRFNPNHERDKRIAELEGALRKIDSMRKVDGNPDWIKIAWDSLAIARQALK